MKKDEDLNNSYIRSHVHFIHIHVKAAVFKKAVNTQCARHSEQMKQKQQKVFIGTITLIHHC